jgi:ATP-dependent Lon protease
MTDKNSIIKNEINVKNTIDMTSLVEKKLEFFKDVIQKTIIHVQKNKFLDILGISDINNCIEKSSELSKKIFETQEMKKVHPDNIINNLQYINNELSGMLKNYGTESLGDLLLICFGSNNKIITNENEIDKFELLKKYFHPTSYKVINTKENTKPNAKQKNEEYLHEKTQNLTCCDISHSCKHFHMKVYGIKLYIHNIHLKKSIVVFGVVDDIIIDFLNDKFINSKLKQIKSNVSLEDSRQNELFQKFLDSFMLKDFLINDTTNDVYNKFMGNISQNNILKQKQISQIVKEFIQDELFNKRLTLMNLLIKSTNYENQYLAYLLYDLLSNDTNGNIDTQEQVILYDSFPWTIKQYFKHAMKQTVQYTNELSNFDINKIPLEQHICLLKVPDSVKEKAMMKLKEVKAKSEDSGSKARQFLDGLLKIPFNIYKKEPILNIMNIIRSQFKEVYTKYKIQNIFSEIPNKEKYTSIEIFKYIKKIEQYNDINNKPEHIEKITTYLISGDKKKINTNVNIINELLQKYNLKDYKIKCNNLNKQQLKNEIEKYIDFCKKTENIHLLQETIDTFIVNTNDENELNNVDIKKDITNITKNTKKITEYMENVKAILDKAVYGHDKAKNQIERIISQWINGEQDGYCFGFEGPPGVGKTSLAKCGLSDCLKDDNGISRPFAMIQMGGDSNGSSRHGHNYTYVGSTWGSIVQILIDKKCMNPIIFIDEVDKISRTEHGKEIVGILTHLLDQTQNDCFQDKYFSGIDLDLSKALFILSYNDADAIDKILLDRVHRIKFSSLSLEDKLVISNNHILPEVYKKMGLEEMIYFSDDVLKYIIEEYTSESGVRKLKEILFEIVGEINLNILKNSNVDVEIPIHISINDIKNKYFKDKHEINHKKIHKESKIGVINGLWANAYGKGGIIQIQVNWRPSEKFMNLYLTGMQGDVMKESMNVALTLAWNLTEITMKQKLRETHYNELNRNGIHIHCPEGAVPKDGPSAGTAITVAIYSLFNNKKIKNNIAITGEISFDGNVTEIGGLDLKILGAIKAGVKEIIFPNENIKDYNNFIEKYKNSELIKGIQFYPVNLIQEVFELVFDV